MYIVKNINKLFLNRNDIKMPFDHATLNTERFFKIDLRKLLFNISKNYDFGSKIEILEVKNGNFALSKFCSKFLPKIGIFVKNQNFCQKSKFCQTSKFLSNIEIFVKNRNFVKHRNFCQTSKFLWNIEIIVKHRNFCQASKFLSKIEILVQKSKFWRKLKIWINIWNCIYYSLARKPVTPILNFFIL